MLETLKWTAKWLIILVNFLSNLTLISQKSPLNLGKSYHISILTFPDWLILSTPDHDVIFTPWGITVTQVLSILKRVSPNKSAGIDGINARWPRLAALVITLSIARMLNYSFSTGTFRQHWKPTEVTPLFKKGDASNPSNYRPISVLTVISIKNYWTLRPRFFVWLFSSEQLDLLPHPQGFSLEEMGGFWIYLDSPVFVSTMVLRLLCLKMKVDELLLNLDNNRVSGVLLVDYCEAFDMVDNCWN